VSSVAASDYGNPISYTPEDRAARAFDGDVDTAWRTGAFDDVRGDRIRVVLDEPITTDRINLVQPLKKPNERWITRAELRFDGGDPITIDLDERASRRRAGQTFRIPRRTFRTLEVTVRDTNLGQVLNYGGVSPVGFAEIRVRDDAPGSRPVRVREVVQMPTDLLSTVGRSSRDHPLVLLMERERVIPVPPRSDPEQSLVRSFSLPTARSFGLGGEVRLSPYLPDDEIDRLLGYTGPVVATSSERLSGAPKDRASAALDGDPATAWVTPFQDVRGQSVTVSLPSPVTLDRLDLSVVADGRHSVPTKLEVINESGERRSVDVPAVKDSSTPDAVTAVPVQFAPLTGSRFTIRVADVRKVTTREWYCECDLTMPVGIAELGMAGVPPVRIASLIPDECRSDLITVDGRPVPARVVGTTAAALALEPLQLRSCTGDAPPTTTLSRGEHVLRTAMGADTGFDVDRLTMASDAGGQPTTSFAADGTVTESPQRGFQDPEPPEQPKLEVTSSGRTKTKVRITGASEPFWLVMGQSENAGWRATVDGDELGESTLTDGYANGWLVRPSGDGPIEATIEWVPQRTVNVAILLSILGVLACLGIVGVAMVRRRRERADGRPAAWEVVDDEPAIGSPLIAPGHRPAGVVVALTTLLAFGLGAFLVTAWVGIVLGVLVLVVLVRPRWRFVLSLLPAVVLAGVGTYIAAKQWYTELPPTFEWPTFFWQVRTAGWVAILLLAGDALVEIARGAVRRPAVRRRDRR
jgi:hypothetical protein